MKEHLVFLAMSVLMVVACVCVVLSAGILAIFLLVGEAVARGRDRLRGAR